MVQHRYDAHIVTLFPHSINAFTRRSIPRHNLERCHCVLSRCIMGVIQDLSENGKLVLLRGETLILVRVQMFLQQRLHLDIREIQERHES
jgi:hypothetical protein